MPRHGNRRKTSNAVRHRSASSRHFRQREERARSSLPEKTFGRKVRIADALVSLDDLPRPQRYLAYVCARFRGNRRGTRNGARRADERIQFSTFKFFNVREIYSEVAPVTSTGFQEYRGTSRNLLFFSYRSLSRPVPSRFPSTALNAGQKSSGSCALFPAKRIFRLCT